MSKPKALILRAPGTNCDVETAFAFEMVGVQAERIHINQIIETPATLADYQILCFPGGFSFGDDIAALLAKSTVEGPRTCRQRNMQGRKGQAIERWQPVRFSLDWLSSKRANSDF